jgi:hypothetical protein
MTSPRSTLAVTRRELRKANSVEHIRVALRLGDFYIIHSQHKISSAGSEANYHSIQRAQQTHSYREFATGPTDLASTHVWQRDLLGRREKS